MSTLELERLDQAARRAEKPLRDLLLAWIAALRSVLGIQMLRDAIRTGAYGQLLSAMAAVPEPDLDLTRTAEREARAALRLVDERFPSRLELRFDVRDPYFARAVYEHQARLVREVNQSTREAIARIVAESYRRGLHPFDFAPRIREIVGLTDRQGLAVLNYAHGLEQAGMPRERITFQSARYARRLRTYRAQTIAATETTRALVVGKLAGFRQAGASGLFNPFEAKLRWDATLDARECPRCRGLEGAVTSFESPSFPDGMPPIHPRCRCTVQLETGER